MAIWGLRLTRWAQLGGLATFPRVRVRRAQRVLNAGAKSPGATRWALVRAWLNSWSTGRRFQASHQCVVCGTGVDILEHLPRCAAVRGSARWLGVSILARSTLGLLPWDGALAGTSAARQAFHVHAAHRAHNAARHVRGPPAGAVAIRAKGRAIVVQHPSLRPLRIYGMLGIQFLRVLIPLLWRMSCSVRSGRRLSVLQHRAGLELTSPAVNGKMASFSGSLVDVSSLLYLWPLSTKSICRRTWEGLRIRKFGLGYRSRVVGWA